MKTARFEPHRLLYYGEVVGVLLAWAVGVAVVLSASGSDRPEEEPQRLAKQRLANAAATESSR